MMTLINAITFIALVIPGVYPEERPGRDPIEVTLPFPTMQRCLTALHEVQKTYPAAVCKDELGVMYNSKTRM